MKKIFSGYRVGRIIIAVACVVWLVCAVDITFGKKKSKTASIEETFCANVFSEVTAQIIGEGEMKMESLTNASIKMVLMKFAQELDINRYTITEDEDGVHLSQLSNNGEVKLDVIKRDEGCYLKSNITLNKGFSSIDSYKTIVEGFYEKQGANANVSVTMSGFVNGRLEGEDMDSLSRKILSSLSAKELTSGKMDEAFTVYGYSKAVKDYLNVGNQKVNINVTMNYEENVGKTRVRLSTPIYNGDY